jgi:hypothetical protein
VGKVPRRSAKIAKEKNAIAKVCSKSKRRTRIKTDEPIVSQGIYEFHRRAGAGEFSQVSSK